MVKKIELSQGKAALVDDADYKWLMQWKWHVTAAGYASRGKHLGYVNGKRKKITVYMHREIVNPPEGFHTDHRDGDRLNNCRKNLRICTITQNNRNIKIRQGCSSQYKGVTWNKQCKRWVAQINKDYLGVFKSEIEAARAYNKEALAYHGEFARINKI